MAPVNKPPPPMTRELTHGEKTKLFSLFENMDRENGFTGLQKTTNSDVLLVDFYNLFIRSFMALPSLNSNGIHVAGICGFLKSLGAAIKLINPSRVIIVIDGKGGSLKRRKLYPEYKAGRSTQLRFNRSYEDLSSPELEEDSMKKQLFRTVSYLDTLPITCVALDNCEADDVIAELAQSYFKGKNVYIASCDKDFLHIVNDNIRVWSPSKKKLYGCAEIFNEYGISCQNFIFYRVLEGDVSDNIPGIKGAGLKTILKCFPFLASSEKSSLDCIFKYCRTAKAKYKLYNSILENTESVERNYQLMQLFDTQLQGTTQLRLMEMMDRPVNRLNKTQFMRLVGEDNMRNNLENSAGWLSECFGKLDFFLREQSGN
jgi:5'-3' exonuclease